MKLNYTVYRKLGSRVVTVLDKEAVGCGALVYGGMGGGMCGEALYVQGMHQSASHKDLFSRSCPLKFFSGRWIEGCLVEGVALLWRGRVGKGCDEGSWKLTARCSEPYPHQSLIEP